MPQPIIALDLSCEELAADDLLPEAPEQDLCVALNRLKAAPPMPGAARPDPQVVDDMAATVMASGLYPRLVVAAERNIGGAGTGYWRVIDGEDTRLALRLLAFRGQIQTSHPVRCRAVGAAVTAVGRRTAAHHPEAARPIATLRAAEEPEAAASEIDLSAEEDLRSALAEDAEAVVVAVVHVFAVTAFYPETCATGVDRRPAPDGFQSDVPMARASRFAERHAAWVRRLPKTVAGLRAYVATMPTKSRIRLLSHCIDLVARRARP